MASKLGASHLKQSRHVRLISSYEITQTVPIFYLVFPAAGFPFNYYDSIASKSIKSSSKIYMHKHKKNRQHCRNASSRQHCPNKGKVKNVRESLYCEKPTVRHESADSQFLHAMLLYGTSSIENEASAFFSVAAAALLSLSVQLLMPNSSSP